MRNQVDPQQLIGKPLKRRKTFPYSTWDFTITIDGLVAGRIMEKRNVEQQLVWFWTMTAPYYPFKQHSGEEETYEQARDAFKALFEEWHSWALRQTGWATWYGSEDHKEGTA
jgi:hypothetical protein